MKYRKPTAQSHMAFSVEYQTMILNSDGSVAKVNPPKHNLILDSGLDRIGVDHIVDCFSYAVVGTGTTPTNRDSATTTFTRSGTTVTASGNFFEAADVGRLLKFDTGDEMYIVTYNSVTEVVVDTSGTLSASEGTVWYVNETGHGTETKRTATYAQDSGDNATTLLSGTLTHKRTFLFSAEVGPVTYTEIGWSWGSSPTDLFGRDLIGGGGDSLVAGQQYKVVLNVTMAVSPATPTAVTDVGNNGFNTAGNATLNGLGAHSYVQANGTRLTVISFPADPVQAGAGKIEIYTSDYTQPTGTTLSTGSSGDVGNLGTNTQASYTNGNFYRDLAIKLGVSEGNTATMYGFNWTKYYNHKFTSPQEKDSDHTLEFTFRQSWDRTLTN